MAAISPEVKEQLAKAGVKSPQLIPSGVKEFPLKPNRAKVIIEKYNPQQLKVIGVVAALTEEKDPLTAVRAVAALRKKRDDFVCIHLGDGPMRGAVEEEIKNCDLLDCYHLAGHNEDLEDFFSIFDAFLLTSVSEGLGSSVLDAFLYEVPAVTTRAGGLVSLVKDRGQLCAQGAANELAEALNKTLNQEKPVPDQIKKAREYVLQAHDLEKITKAYVRIYEELSAAKK